MFASYVNLEAQSKKLFENDKEFKRVCGDVTKDPVTVYSPLSQKALAELQLIREVSKTLQKKKEEDMKKDAQAAAEDKKDEEDQPQDKIEDEESK